jgi:hypothetical protein
VALFPAAFFPAMISITHVQWKENGHRFSHDERKKLLEAVAFRLPTRSAIDETRLAMELREKVEFHFMKKIAGRVAL